MGRTLGFFETDFWLMARRTRTTNAMAAAYSLAILAWLCVGLARGATPESMATVMCGADSYRASGVIVATNGDESLVLTVAHLFDGANRNAAFVRTTLSPGAHKARVLAIASKHNADVAVLLFGHKGYEMQAVPLAARGPRAGDSVSLYSYPMGSSTQTKRTGIIHSVGFWLMPGGAPIVTTSFPAVSGESGAPLFAGGEVGALNWGSDGQHAHTTPAEYVWPVLTQACGSGGCDWFPQQRQRPPSRVVHVRPRPQPLPAPSVPQLPGSRGGGTEAPPRSAGLSDKDITKLLDRMAADPRFKPRHGKDGADGKDGNNGLAGKSPESKREWP